MTRYPMHGIPYDWKYWWSKYLATLHADFRSAINSLFSSRDIARNVVYCVIVGVAHDVIE